MIGVKLSGQAHELGNSFPRILITLANLPLILVLDIVLSMSVQLWMYLYIWIADACGLWQD